MSTFDEAKRRAIAGDPGSAPPSCEACRGVPMEELAWMMFEAGMLCPDHADAYRRWTADTRLRAVLPRRQWTTHPLPPPIEAFDLTTDLGVFAYGPAGRGKSNALAGMLKRAYVEHARRTGYPPDLRWWQVADLMDELRDRVGSKRSVEEALRPLYTCHRLVLDDLGAERSTAWALERITLLIGKRYDNCLPTDITSNFDLGQLAGHLTPTDDPESPAASRIVSRIAEVCVQVPFNGPDHRLTIARNRAK